MENTSIEQSQKEIKMLEIMLKREQSDLVWIHKNIDKERANIRNKQIEFTADIAKVIVENFSKEKLYVPKENKGRADDFYLKSKIYPNIRFHCRICSQDSFNIYSSVSNYQDERNYSYGDTFKKVKREEIVDVFRKLYSDILDILEIIERK